MSTPNKVKLMVDGVLEDALVRVDANGEFACYCKPSGRAFFFPKDSDLSEEVAKHNAANKEKPVFSDGVEAGPDTELAAWLGNEAPENEDDE